MPSTLLIIFLMHWVVLLTPGVNFVLLLQLTATGTRSTALAAVAGITSATFIWALLAVFGVGIIFAAHPALRLGVQVAGGAYLLWVAWKLWHSKATASEENALDYTHAKAFRVGFATNILNPKPAVFFGSVFVNAFPQNPSAVLIVISVVMVYCNAVVWHAFLALAFSQSRVQGVYLRFRTHLNRLASLVIAGFGGRLLLSTFSEFQSVGSAK